MKRSPSSFTNRNGSSNMGPESKSCIMWEWPTGTNPAPTAMDMRMPSPVLLLCLRSNSFTSGQ